MQFDDQEKKIEIPLGSNSPANIFQSIQIDESYDFKKMLSRFFVFEF